MAVHPEDISTFPGALGHCINPLDGAACRGTELRVNREGGEAVGAVVCSLLEVGACGIPDEDSVLKAATAAELFKS